MSQRKRLLDPFQSKRKTLEAINVYQSRMLRIEPNIHNSELNDAASFSSHDDVETEQPKRVDDLFEDHCPKHDENYTLRSIIEPDNHDSELNDAANISSHDDVEIEQPKRVVDFIDDHCFEHGEDHTFRNIIEHNNRESELFDAAEFSSLQDGMQIEQPNRVVDFIDEHCLEHDGNRTFHEMKNSSEFEVSNKTLTTLPLNQSLISTTKLQSRLEEKSVYTLNQSDDNSSSKENIPEIKQKKIEILEDCNLVLDPVTGYFCRRVTQEKEVNETRDTDSEMIHKSENDIIMNDTQELTDSRLRKRIRKEPNTFLKSCMDFREGSENEDFSTGSSDDWSAKESGNSTCSEKQKKMIKNKTANHKNQEATNFKKIKKVNVSKIRKTKKDKGECYETKAGKTIEAKSMKPNPCLDSKCKRSCKNIPEERRESIFKFYWDLSVQRRKDWLLRCAQRVPIKRRKTNENTSRRTVTYEYFLNNGEDFIQICQKFLLHTLDVTQRQLLYVLSNEKEEMSQADRRHSNVPIKYNEEVVKYAKQYIESLPAVPSHYCRPDTSKVYLPQEFKNISNLYRLYLKNARDDRQPQVLSEKIFRNIFTGEYNLGFHMPKKDKCVLCTKIENQEGDLTEGDAVKIKEHIEEKKASYDRFKLHQNLIDSETITASFDLQKVLNTPHGESMLLYYSRKYAMYNLTFYESRTQNVICYLWGETEGKRGSQEISSCLNLYLKNIDNRGIKNILLYCDSCFGQNKNKVVLAALNNFLKTSKHLETIQINYLIPGHTYMPVDSVHAVIENEVKKLIVWSPSQWPTYIELARKRPRPYQVHVLDHTDFLNFEELASKAFTPQLTKKMKIRQIKIVTMKKKYPDEIMIKYSMKPGSEVYKLKLNEKPLNDKSVRPKRGKGKGKGKKLYEPEDSNLNQTEVIDLKPLYKTRLSLSIAKYKDLKQLCEKGTVPKRFHDEYLQLPFSNGVPDTLAETDEEDEEKGDPED